MPFRQIPVTGGEALCVTSGYAGADIVKLRCHQRVEYSDRSS